MQWEIHFDPVELRQPPLGERPEGFNAVDVHPVALGKLVLLVVHPQMLVVADGHQPIVSPPAIGIDHGLLCHFPENEILKCLLLAVGYDLGEDFTLALKDAEDGLLQRASTTLKLTMESSSAPGSKVGLVALGLADDLAFLLDSMGVDRDPKPQKVVVDCLAVHSDQ